MKQRFRVKFVQLPIPEIEHLYREGNIPLAAGYLKAYALGRGVARDQDIQIIPRDIANFGGDAAVIKWLMQDRPTLVGFTSYMWNIERNLWLARQLKEQDPAVKIILGGPEITPYRLLAEDSSIDAGVAGEGEQAFLDLLSAFGNRQLQKRIYYREEPVDLSALPNPYLEKIVVPQPGEPLFLETMRGCPYACKYCFYASLYRGMRFFPDRHLPDIFALARACGVPEIFLMDPSFNVAPGIADRLKGLARLNTSGIPLHTEMRLEAVTPGIAQLMEAAGFRSVEVGLQSVNPRSLAAIGRSWDRHKFIEGAKRLQNHGIDIKTGVILGLPHDGIGDFSRTLDFVLDLNLTESLEIYPLSMLPGTRLRDEARDLGMTFMPRPPYWVLSTPQMSADDFKIAVTLAEEKLDIEFFPPLIPRFGNGQSRSHYLCFLDLRKDIDARLNYLYRQPEKLGHSLTILVHRDVDTAARIDRLARWLQRQSPFTLVQLVMEHDTLPAVEDIRLLANSFSPEPHYFDRIHHYKVDRQQTYSFRFFLLTPRLDTAEKFLHTPQYGDLVLKYTPELLSEGRHILAEHPILLVDTPIADREREELRGIYADFEQLLIFRNGW